MYKVDDLVHGGVAGQPGLDISHDVLAEAAEGAAGGSLGLAGDGDQQQREEDVQHDGRESQLLISVSSCAF